MHWTPEHAQSVRHWPEQHLDVSSTTSSPAHKSELHGGRGRSYSYAWANDDISALTASSLLKRYAEKYSGALDSPYDRAPMGGYPEAGPFGPLNGQKGELDPWPLSHAAEGPYALAPPPGHEGLGGAKVAGAGSTGGSERPLGPGYTPPGPVYNYSTSSYPHQPSLAPSYTHPSAPYLPSSLAAPTPLPPRPTVVGGSYVYQGQGLGGVEPGGTLKRKAFEMSVEEEEGEGSRYRKYGYEHTKPGGGSPYSVSDSKAECHSNGFGPASAGPQAFKPSKPPSQTGGEELGKFGGLKPLVSPPYGGGLARAAGRPEPFCCLGPEAAARRRWPGAWPPSWVRPSSGVSGASLASEWKGEAEKLLRALFSAAAARQPAVVLVSQAEALADEGPRRQLRSCLEATQAGTGAAGLVIAVCATRRPDLLEDAMHRCFAKRYCVGLPDAGGRRQVLLQALAPLGCRLSERELAAVLQRTEGFSVPELHQLCQQASASASAPSPARLHGLPTPLAPPAFKDFENAFCKVRPHATAKELDTCAEWSKLHGQ
ncbi:hypothetical protein SKAU_G00100640 [Synaphobranchus kaupii]|uniref:ATPase AAA-type core domain-containing protein n=1 Tax=Synaphobranchus kaupii TaxID=118154 RepID=A0A9Q1J7D4_SYNKA|nr:hypothetical protein SKAU_G00100640 [Synaphobranchus kaupii]